MSDHTITFYRDKNGPRISVDAPGVAAVSAPITDPFAFLETAADQLGLQTTRTEGVLSIQTPE